MSKHKHKNYFNTPKPQEGPSDALERVESNDKVEEVEVIPEKEVSLVEPSEASEDVSESTDKVEEPVSAVVEPSEVVYKMVIANRFVNLRKEPSTESPSKRVIKDREIIKVSDYDDEWYAVWDINTNLIGYTMKEFFSQID